MIRVLLADDHPIVLAGIRALLAEAPDMIVVGEATNGADALRLIRETGPDIAVLDVSMPGLNGLQIARELADAGATVKLLVLTMHEDASYAQHMLQAGARGFMIKRSAAEGLVRAIRAIAAGGVYLDPTIAPKLIAGSLGADAPRLPEEKLSRQEVNVLRLTALGYSNKEVANRLNVSVKTVETYKARATTKLRLRTRADIVRYGVSRNWFDTLEGG